MIQQAAGFILALAIAVIGLILTTNYRGLGRRYMEISLGMMARGTTRDPGKYERRLAAQMRIQRWIVGPGFVVAGLFFAVGILVGSAEVFGYHR